jgi:hypothetical protein
MLHLCVYKHSRLIENHPIWILEDGALIFEVVLSQAPRPPTSAVLELFFSSLL